MKCDSIRRLATRCKVTASTVAQTSWSAPEPRASSLEPSCRSPRYVAPSRVPSGSTYRSRLAVPPSSAGVRLPSDVWERPCRPGSLPCPGVRRSRRGLGGKVQDAHASLVEALDLLDFVGSHVLAAARATHDAEAYPIRRQACRPLRSGPGSEPRSVRGQLSVV